MNGNVERPRHAGWFARLAQQRLTYFAVDGGAGAHQLAVLARQSPYLVPIGTPRHADCLLIVAPLSQKLAAAVDLLRDALPAHAKIILYHPAELPDMALPAMPDTTLSPDAQPLTTLTAAAVRAAYLSAPEMQAMRLPLPLTDVTIDLPSPSEIATELVVLSLGPVQPFTAGPARFWLICDGEQVVECRVEAGYAARGIATMMTGVTWERAAHLAAQYDPLAPIAGRLAFVQAVEQVQNYQPDDFTREMRADALALERAQNVLWWYVRFLQLLALTPRATHAAALANALDDAIAQVWSEPPATWIAPQQSASSRVATTLKVLQTLAHAIAALAHTARTDRWLKLRTVGIGAMELHHRGTVPNGLPGMEGSNDVQSRLLTRLQLAVSALDDVVGHATLRRDRATRDAIWQVPAGEATSSVAGPRGAVRAHLVSAGTANPHHVTWSTPSAAILPLIPQLFAGQKVADAEIILASFDLVMAEADG